MSVKVTERDQKKVLTSWRVAIHGVVESDTTEQLI